MPVVAAAPSTFGKAAWRLVSTGSAGSVVDDVPGVKPSERPEAERWISTVDAQASAGAQNYPEQRQQNYEASHVSWSSVGSPHGHDAPAGSSRSVVVVTMPITRGAGSAARVPIDTATATMAESGEAPLMRLRR